MATTLISGVPRRLLGPFEGRTRSDWRAHHHGHRRPVNFNRDRARRRKQTVIRSLPTILELEAQHG